MPVVFFFFFFEHRLSTPVGTPNLSMQVKMQPTYLALGVDFCVHGRLYSRLKGSRATSLGRFKRMRWWAPSGECVGSWSKAAHMAT